MSSTDIFKARTKRIRFSFSGKVIGPLIILVIVIATFLFHQQYLIVRTLECWVGERVCPESISNIVSESVGKSFLKLNKRQLIKKIEATGLVGETQMTLVFPGKLTFSARPPSITYYVKSVFSPLISSLSQNDSSSESAQVIPPSVELSAFAATVSGKTFALLSTGVLNQEDAETSFYLISENIPSKDYLSRVFYWLKSFGESHIQPEALFLLPNMVVVKQKDQPDWLMNFSASPREALLALQSLAEVVTIKKPAVIDFRYANPILK